MPRRSAKAVLGPLAEACPKCHPGDHPSVFPFLVAQENGKLRAWYKHGPCWISWTCLWDSTLSHWPLEREVAPERELERSPEPLGALLDEMIGALAGLFDGEEADAA